VQSAERAGQCQVVGAGLGLQSVVNDGRTAVIS